MGKKGKSVIVKGQNGPFYEYRQMGKSKAIYSKIKWVKI